jgi:uncharacterized membrane protein YdbT with pleckstrin-like domain
VVGVATPAGGSQGSERDAHKAEREAQKAEREREREALKAERERERAERERERDRDVERRPSKQQRTQVTVYACMGPVLCCQRHCTSALRVASLSIRA